MASENKYQEGENEPPIHGDILEAILSHVPLVHLVPARHVSKAWKRAVSTSLRHVNPIKPWLIVHTQSPRDPHVTTSHAYDPRSRAWVEIHAPPLNLTSALRSSHSSLLYSISPKRFSFSVDPLHLQWHHAQPPRLWRIDPVVACVGSKIVVAGGACEFEDDPLAVEIYDAESFSWTRCQSMPAILKDSTASTWLSVAVAGGTIFVTEKNSGMTYSFDCESGTWLGPHDLSPDDGVFSWAIGAVRNRLILAGTIGEGENVKGVKLWEVKGELGIEYRCEELAAMPDEMVEKLKGEDGCGAVASVTVTTAGDFVCIGNPSKPEEMVVCEVGSGGGGCEWWSLRNAVVAEDDGARMRRMVFCGGDVGLEDLQTAVLENCRFNLL